ncbi:MAG: cadherin repeat domain-containing protein, partial [Gammaproteobacteria bacterium]|nr:cadherin repeat domain-containing protein [Gammaproteobacteria bacterium]
DPVITSGSSGTAVDHGAVVGTQVYTATYDDSGDISGGVTWTVVNMGGYSHDHFEINSSTGVVTTKTVMDYRDIALHWFSVKATDAAGNYNSKSVSVDVNEPPDIDTQTVTVGYRYGYYGSNYHGYYDGIITANGADIDDGTTDVYSGGTIVGIYFKSGGSELWWRFVGTTTDSGWDEMIITDSSGNEATFTRSSGTHSTSYGSSYYKWTSVTNPFDGHIGSDVTVTWK